MDPALVLRTAPDQVFSFWQRDQELYWSPAPGGAGELLLSGVTCFSACWQGKTLYLVAATVDRGLVALAGEGSFARREQLPLDPGIKPYGLALVPAQDTVHLFYLTFTGQQTVLWHVARRGDGWDKPRLKDFVAGDATRTDEDRPGGRVCSVIDTAGRLHLVYAISDGANLRLVHQLASVSASAWSKPMFISGTGRDAIAPALLADGDGSVHAAWAQATPQGWEVKYRRWLPGPWPQGGWQQVESFPVVAPKAVGGLPQGKDPGNGASAARGWVVPALGRWQDRVYLLWLAGDRIGVARPRGEAVGLAPRPAASSEQGEMMEVAGSEVAESGITPLRYGLVAGEVQAEWSTTALGAGLPPQPLSLDRIMAVCTGAGPGTPENGRALVAAPAPPAQGDDPTGREEEPRLAVGDGPSRPPEGRRSLEEVAGLLSETPAASYQRRVMAAQFYRELQRLEREMARAQGELRRLEQWYGRLVAAWARLVETAQELGRNM